MGWHNIRATIKCKGQREYNVYTHGTSLQITDKSELENALNILNDCKAALEFITKRRVEELSLSLKEMKCIPIEAMMKMSKLRAAADGIWKKAKSDNAFKSFVPILKNMMELAKEFAIYVKPNDHPFATMLDNFYRGSIMALFFSPEKTRIIFFINCCPQFLL